MKKIKLLLFNVCLFLLFTTVVNAENITLASGSTGSGTTGYKYSNCSSDGDEFLDYSISSSGKLTYSFKSGVQIPDEKTVTLTCDYTTESELGVPKSGKQTIKVTHSGRAVIRVSLGMTTANGGVYAPTLDLVSSLPAGSTVKSYEIGDYGSEYIVVNNCSGNSCVISISDEGKTATSNGSSKSAVVDLTYENNGEEYSVLFNIVISAYTGARIFTGNVGTCNIDSSLWTPRTWTSAGGDVYYFYGSNSSGAPLPNCNADNSKIPVEFKGWRKEITDKNKVYALGECTGTLPAGTAAEDGVSYTTCYERVSYVQISPGNGTVDAASGWEFLKGNSGYFYSAKNASETTVALPSLIFSGKNKNSKLEYWYNSKGEKKQPGEIVDLDGQIWYAHIVTESNIVENEYERVKEVKVDYTEVLVVSGMKSCYSSNEEFARATPINGECQVGGKKVTPDDSPVAIQVTLDTDETLTYYFNVVDVGTITNIVPTHDYEVNLGVNSEVTNKQSWYQQYCTEFVIEGDTGSANYTNDGEMTGVTYVVTQACANGYYAFCLDPGLNAPTGNVYKRTADIDSGGNEMRRLIEAYVSLYGQGFSNFTDAGDPNRIAMHIAIRAFSIKLGYSSSQAGSKYEWYKSFADSLGSYESASNHIDGMNLVDGVADVLKNVLSKYYDSHSSSSDEVEEFERTVDITNSKVEGKGYTLTYEGYIIAPSSVTKINSLTMEQNVCDSLGMDECKAELKYDETETANRNNRKTYRYKVTFRTSDASKVKPIEVESESENDKTVNERKKEKSFRVDFEGTYINGDIAIVAPIDSSSVQRMFVFNVETPDVFVYFSYSIQDCNIDALDYKKYCTNSGCDEGFNEELFQASGCCKLVTDEVTYKYVIDNYCSGRKCVSSNMSSVCSLNETSVGSAELYEIRDGSQYNPDTGTYTQDINSCIIEASANVYSTGHDNVTKVDVSGNELGVSTYSTNRYCDVACGEYWQISLESFGNYVGINAVAAGTYFSTQFSDIFISGTRTCYSSKIDYNAYMEDLVNESGKAIEAYNKYSEASHTYLELNKQAEDVDTNVEVKKFDYCVKLPAETDGWELVDHNDNGEGNYKKTISATQSNSSTGGHTYTCPTGYTLSGTNCVKTEAKCSQWGTYYEYYIKNMKKVEEGKYDDYSNNVSGNQTSNSTTATKTEYFESGQSITCVPTAASAGGEATITCKHSGYSADHEGYENAICSSYVSANRTFCASTDGSYDKNKAFEDMKTVVQKKAKEIMDTQANVASAAVNTIHSYSAQMFSCQNFELYNASDEKKYDSINNQEYANNSPTNGLYMDGEKKEFVQITTEYNPHVTYEYDEEEFMTLIGNDNILEEYIQKNDKIMEAEERGKYSSTSNDSVETELNAYRSDNNTQPVESIKVNLSRNDIDTTFYSSLSNVKEYTGSTIERNLENNIDRTAYTTSNIVFCVAGSTNESYNPSLSKYEWSSGKCYVKPIYYRQASNVKSSISNSSFYKNKGRWYVGLGDLKIHGDNLNDAIEKAKALDNSHTSDANYVRKNFTPLGADTRESQVSIFPVALDTPRNLYLYSYEFGDIGMYSDGKIGRLMGDESSLISLNTRTCFYEVYEEICLCCGSSINSYVGNYDAVNDYLNSHSSITYEPSQTTDGLIVDGNGVIGFATSTVSLNDLQSESTRSLKNNWGTSEFLFSGTLYETNKGADLLVAIESEGENAYDANAEYAYRLTPSTISAIREYNDNHGYEVNYNNLKVYGTYAVLSKCDGSGQSSESCWNVSDTEKDDYITFSHYGSTFLEEYMSDLGAVYSNTIANRSSIINSTCFVNSSEAQSYETIRKKVEEEGCRWVDYLEEDNGKYYRLAFK